MKLGEYMRYKKVKKASILGIIGNVFLFLIKGIIGFITGSQAMIADFFNSAGDTFSSIMTFIGNKIASKKPDDDHDLGHGKAEYIFSLLISLTIMVTSLLVIKESVNNLIYNPKYKFSIWLCIVSIITILIKLFLFLYTKTLAKKMNNLLIEANSKDHRNDCFITLLTLFSSICGYYKIYRIDGIIGILISIWLLYQGFIIFKKAYDVLMDKTMSIDIKNKVIDIIKRNDKILKYNHFNSTPVGYKYQISLSIFVDGNLSTFESHKIADELEKEIINKIDEIYLAVIHVNPI